MMITQMWKLKCDIHSLSEKVREAWSGGFSSASSHRGRTTTTGPALTARFSKTPGTPNVLTSSTTPSIADLEDGVEGFILS